MSCLRFRCWRAEWHKNLTARTPSWTHENNPSYTRLPFNLQFHFHTFSFISFYLFIYLFFGQAFYFIFIYTQKALPNYSSSNIFSTNLSFLKNIIHIPKQVKTQWFVWFDFLLLLVTKHYDILVLLLNHFLKGLAWK